MAGWPQRDAGLVRLRVAATRLRSSSVAGSCSTSSRSGSSTVRSWYRCRSSSPAMGCGRPMAPLTSGNTRPRYTPSTQEEAHSRTSDPRFADQHAAQLRNPGARVLWIGLVTEQIVDSIRDRLVILRLHIEFRRVPVEAEVLLRGGESDQYRRVDLRSGSPSSRPALWCRRPAALRPVS
jgi:hypothetical protein